MQKYGFGNDHGNGRNTDFMAKTNDFTVNAAYISVAVNSKNFIICLRYGDAVLFLRNGSN